MLASDEARFLVRRSVISVELLRSGTVAPIPVLVLAVVRRTLELLLGEIHLVSTQTLVVRQDVPRQRVVIFANTHEPTEAHYGVRDFAAEFVDHHSLYGADLFAIRAVDRRILYFVTGDE